MGFCRKWISILVASHLRHWIRTEWIKINISTTNRISIWFNKWTTQVYSKVSWAIQAWATAWKTIKWDSPIRNTIWWIICDNKTVAATRTTSTLTHSSTWWTTTASLKTNYTVIHKDQRRNLAIQHNITSNSLMLQVIIVLAVKITEVDQVNHIQAPHQISWDKELQLLPLIVIWWTSIIKWTLIRCLKCNNSNKTITMEDNPNIERYCCWITRSFDD